MTVLAVRRAQELCEFCPKMCRFACPVSEVTHREALTPWAKVSLAAMTARAPDASAAQAFAGCTGCLRCSVYCAHDNDVPSVLYAARAATVRAGVAPEAFASLPGAFSRQGHAEERDLAAVHRALEAGAQPAGAGALLFPGCDALAQGGELARLALQVSARLRAPLTLAPEEALCCGLKLREGGHPELYSAHRSRLRRALGAQKKPLSLVFLQPACAQDWDLPEGSVVEHITTYLARALVALPEELRPAPLPESLVFHDPCQLARGLQEVTAPRALLAASVRDLREPLRSGVDTSCCGAGGLLPRSMPEAAQAMAQARRAELGPQAVSCSPACSAALGAEELLSVLARWLAQQQGATP